MPEQRGPRRLGNSGTSRNSGSSLASRLVSRLTDSLALQPLLGILAGVLLALALSETTLRPGWLDHLLALNRADAASLLGVIVGGVLSSLAFVASSLMVTLQLASSQFSPRLLRIFLRDDTTKGVLAVLTTTVAYGITLAARWRTDDGERPPEPATAFAVLLGLASVAALVYFIAHIARVLRVDTMMKEVNRQTLISLHHEYGEQRTTKFGRLPEPPECARALPMPDDGFVDGYDLGELARRAREHDCVVRLEAFPGLHVVAGAPLGWVWSERDELGVDVADLVHGVVAVSFERTPFQDTAFGFRRLVDIAVKAMSPAVNDPTTAGHAVGHLSALLRRLVEHGTRGDVVCDDDGRVRVIVVRPDLPFYLALTCGQLRRFGAGEVALLVALLALLRDTAASLAGRDGPGASEDRDGRAVLAEAALLVEAAEQRLSQDADLEVVRSAAASVTAALKGDLRAAYAHRLDEALAR
ncbi:MAG: DUF2254 domain-containing protein [Actinomycetales bacterium]